MEKAEYIWLDGKFVKWDAAQVHVLTHTLHYGYGAFEGIRCYATADGPAVFRLDEHLRRLENSCRLLLVTPPYSIAEIRSAVLELIRRNRLDHAYIRPLVAVGHGEVGLGAIENPPRVAIAAFRWGAYLGQQSFKSGIKMKVSSFVRLHPNSVLVHAKVCGHYVNNVLAKTEARRNGADEALLLDTDGYLAEGSGENVFLVRRGVLVSPDPATHFAGITRDTVIEIARERGIAVEERRVARDEVYLADEAFVCGTAAEVTPVREVDGRTIGTGSPGPVTREISAAFFDAVHGRVPERFSWLARVEAAPARKPIATGGKERR